MRRGELCVLIFALLFISMFNINVDAQDEEGLVFWSVEFNSTVRNNYHVCSIVMTVYNPHNETVEENFYLDIPDGAMLTQMTIEKDNRTYVSKVEMKEKAKQEYDTAVQNNRTASLIEFTESGGYFSISLGVDPGSVIKLEVQYGEVMAKYLGQYDLCIPFDIVGNYADFRKVSMDSRIETLNDLMDLNLTRSTIDAFVTHQDRTSVHYAYSSDGTTAGDMFYLKYSQGPLPENGIMDFHIDNRSGYFMHVFCPQVEQIGGYIPKDIVFVLDRSGSMDGQKMETVKSSFSNIIDQIDEGDGFNIVHFNDRSDVYSEKMVDASPVEKERASRAISSLSAGGYTDINEAMLEALGLFDERSFRVPIIVFLTDGNPTAGEDRPLAIRANIRDANDLGVVIHTLGYGDDHDADLLKAIALENEGEYRYIVDSSDADRLFEGHYSSISHPLLRDLVFSYSEGTSDVIPGNLSILFEGSEAVIVGRYDPNMTEICSSVVAEGTEGAVCFNDAFQVPEGEGKEFIARLWAHRMISNLLDRILVEGEKVELVDEVVSLGMNYSFVTPYTSFILVLQEEERDGASENGSIPEGKQYDHSYEPDYFDPFPYDPAHYAPQCDSDSGVGNNADPYSSDFDGMPADWDYPYWDPPGNSASHPALPPQESEDSSIYPGSLFIGIGIAVFILAAGLSAIFIILRKPRFVVITEE